MFRIDDRIQSTSFILGDWPLSRVFLKNEAQFPWFILVPRVDNIEEIYQLNKEQRQVLMEEINQLSLLVKAHFKPDKLNVGALGNVVSQLHVHVVARDVTDSLWPQGIWHSLYHPVPYDAPTAHTLVMTLKDHIDEKGRVLGSLYTDA
ncbi:HIT domain-containing protein [Legionella worsleiensis]|uniref:Diadenosine tetraphosphate (Ap4A) hydrolase-like HIT family hydrolase n=1 Tax=Legionella worsleiensis TaxID=45076 RepID=A0A0W1AK22_9GAMM|nr:HIT domain-containing protein [Legionella worsleiensis]KTD81708.1 diadenosine tetraphosphate (Ap4A) hydrolase-like HIT family hydrolase [Legionella worsleiensis]STY31882.1 diadenosine tetraphosphate (Ap4A) hydrolase-like HIT family hydrolase [Legionella worsleiensis]